MALSTVAVTGGNGKIGRAVLEHLGEVGYETVNVDLATDPSTVADHSLTVDLLDAGETYGALAKADADAVVHMGTIPDPYGHPQHVTYRSNVQTAMHVLEASESLGLESVCLASSINALGAEHQQRPADVRYLPVDEDHPATPDDAYGIAKHAMEGTADGFGRRPDSDLTIASVRFPWVATGAELRERFAERDRSLAGLDGVPSDSVRDVFFSYLHVADAASLARAAIEADHDGHEVFWAVAADTSSEVPTKELINEYYPDVETRMDFEGHESLVDTSKVENLLGWSPEHSWRDSE